MTILVQEMFFQAVYDDDLVLLKKAHDQGANINAVRLVGPQETMLHHACSNGKNEIVRQLLKWDAKTDIYNGAVDARTPLMVATEYGNVEGMWLLISQGANINLLSKKGLSLSAIAAVTRKNADEVWDMLLDPDNLEAEYLKPSNDAEGELLFKAVDSCGFQQNQIDEKSVAALIRHGADAKVHSVTGDSILHRLISLAIPDANNARTRIERIARVIKHTLEAGVSPRLKNKAYVPAIEEARHIPELYEVLLAECKSRAEKGLTDFKPVTETLVGKDGSVTDFAMFCCHAELLGEALSRERWKNNPRGLIKAKQALNDALPLLYQEQNDTLLDTSQQRRDQVNRGDSLLRQRLHPLGGRHTR